MTESMPTGQTQACGYRGEDFVCRNCGCEIMVKHWGEPRSHADGGTFTCHCGKQMEPEHPGQTRADGDGFDQEDFLGHGGGAGEASGVGHTSSSSVSPGGGR